MPTSNAPLSIAEVLRLRDQEWINEGLIATVVSITQKTSTKTRRDFWVCQLADASDGQDTVECALFTAPKFREGDRISLTGKGVKFEVGEYGPKVTVGRTSEVRVMEISRSADLPARQPVARRDDSRGGNGGDPAPHDEANAAAAALAKASHLRINGQTVGMAMKEALDVLTSGLTHDEVVERLIAPPFWASVHEVASDIIRVSMLLEAGNLAKPIKQRAEGSVTPRPAPPKAAQPPVDETVPF